MNACTCPSRTALHDYLRGRLAVTDAAAVDSHLDECADCLAVADTLEDDTAPCLARLHAAPADETPFDDPAYQRLVERAKALGAEAADDPAVLGPYALRERLGAGGMGRVYRAEHTLLKRVVAVKVLAPELVRSPTARARFRREVEAAARVDSPHVVAALDAGEHDGRDYLVMEYVEGCDLADLVKREGPLPWRVALTCVLHAARGLAAAHAAGIVHRDVKPANLIAVAPAPSVSEGSEAQPTVKVLDLGLARLHLDGEPASGALTATTAIMGTAHYMAPEQALDTRSADERSDVYALGCTLFFLLTGRPPYEGRTVMETLLAHRERPVPSLRAAAPECPAGVERLFAAMVAKRAEDRPASMAAVADEAERLLSAEGAMPRRPRRGWLVAAGLLGAAALIAVGLFAAGRGMPSTEKAPQQTPAAITPQKEKKPALAMVRVPAGSFWMGSSDGDPRGRTDERPRRRITLKHAFLLGKTEITQSQYEEITGANPSAFSAKGRHGKLVAGLDTRQHPVDSVSWLDAVRFCNRLSEKHGLTPHYRIVNTKVTFNQDKGARFGYRLPTEAEWEHACRGGTDSTWSFGESPAELTQHAWFAVNSGDVTHPVGTKKANPFGLHDMYGNVPEWCWDRYAPNSYLDMPASDPPGSGRGNERVYRGGAWNSLADQVRSAARLGLGLAYGTAGSPHVVGFRVARNVEE